MQMKSLQRSKANSDTTNQNIRTDGVKAYFLGERAPQQKNELYKKPKHNNKRIPK